VGVVQDSSVELKRREGQEDRRGEEYRVLEGPISTAGLVQPPDLKVKEGPRPPSQSYLVISELSHKLSSGLGSSAWGFGGGIDRDGVFHEHPPACAAGYAGGCGAFEGAGSVRMVGGTTVIPVGQPIP